MGRAARRLMGSTGLMPESYDLLIRNNEPENIAASAVETGR
jgi:hypothetical protein